MDNEHNKGKQRMKIFYGVQGTGNGHITRARVLAKEFKELGLDVTYMFSGRPADKFFDMEIFGDYIVKTGLTFNITKGKVNLFETIREAKIKTLIHDIQTLDLSGYDIVISDYEPITAWAGVVQNIHVIGIGHQYAFNYNIPKSGNNFITDLVMKYFAPTDISIGVHWHHFSQHIIPPIIETLPSPAEFYRQKYVVYLPFEDQQDVLNFLIGFKGFDFHVYSSDKNIKSVDNVIFKELSRDGFQADVRECAGVICNAGFELASEALQLGKKLLVKPVKSQMEQCSNAFAIDELNYGYTMDKLDSIILANWLVDPNTIRVEYPNVARFLANVLVKRGHLNLSSRDRHKLWRQVKITKSSI